MQLSETLFWLNVYFYSAYIFGFTSRCQATFATFPKGRPWLTQASASWPLWPARDGPDRQFQQIFLTLSTDTR